MTKKRLSRTLTKLLPVRVSEEHLKLFHKAAAKDGRPMSNWVRDRLQKAAKRELKK